MDMGYEHEIRERAYAIWMAAGMVDGEAESHWLHAETALRNETETPRGAAHQGAEPAKHTKTAKPARATPAAAPAKAKTGAATKSAKPARSVAKAGAAGRKGRPAADGASLGAGV